MIHCILQEGLQGKTKISTLNAGSLCMLLNEKSALSGIDTMVNI
jgi:hypothetical protein